MSISREPLVQFFFIGALLYGGYFLFIRPNETEEPKQQIIHIDENKISWFKTLWEKKWRRPPSPEELEEQIERYKKETVYYREALALGLDQDDLIIRRHLADKLSFLRENLSPPAKPSRQTLIDYYQANPERYTSSLRYSLKHLYFNPESGREKTRQRVNRALEYLTKNPQGIASVPTDPLSLKSQYEDKGEKSLSRIFGSRFVDALVDQPVGKWVGPVASGYGIHLVYIDSRIEPALIDFEQVADRVEQNWMDEQRAFLSDQYYQSLRLKYDFVVDNTALDSSVQGQ